MIQAFHRRGKTIAWTDFRFYSGVSAFVLGFIVYEALYLVLAPTTLTLRLLTLVPLYIGLAWGGCYAVFGEFWRVEEAVRDTPTLVPLRNAMRSGLIIFLATTIGVSVLYNAELGLFHIDLPYPPLLSWVRRFILFAAVFMLGGAAIVSRRASYRVIPRRSIPLRAKLSLQWTSRFSGWILLWVGLYIASLRSSTVAAAISLSFAGVVLYSFGTLLRHRSMARFKFVRASSVPSILSTKMESSSASRDEPDATIPKRVCNQIIKEHGKKILSVFLAGVRPDSISGTLQLDPDLEFISVIKGYEWIPKKQFVYEGVAVAIYYWPESSLMSRAREFDEDWPEWASYLRVKTVLYDPRDWLKNLEKAFEESDRTDLTDALREAAWKIVKWLLYLKRESQRQNSIEMMNDCRSIASASVNLVYILNRMYWVRSYWSDVFSCPVQPSDFRRLVETAAGFARPSDEEAVAAAEKLGREMLELVRSRGVVLETSKLE